MRKLACELPFQLARIIGLEFKDGGVGSVFPGGHGGMKRFEGLNASPTTGYFRTT